MLGLVALVLVISYASTLRAWLEQRDELADAKAELASVQDSVDDLERTRARWDDDAYVAAQARERLGWLLPGEVGYRVIDADGEPIGQSLPDEPVTDEPGAEVDWYVDVWGSVQAAGDEPEQETEPEPVPVDPDPGGVLRPEGGGDR